MRLALVVNRFPSLSESFIVNKVIRLIENKVDLTVVMHDPDNDQPQYAEKLKNIQVNTIDYSFLSRNPLLLPLHFTPILAKSPLYAGHLWRKTVQLYGAGIRALKAYLLALPLASGRYDIIHFEFSGIAVSYLDALPLLAPTRLLTSCRGAAEQIVPLIDPQRGELLNQVFQYMHRVHCVSVDMLRTVQRYGLSAERAFVNHPAVDLEEFCRSKPYPNKEQGPFRLVSIGRLHWKKGLEFGLLAVRQLLDQGRDVLYDIVGGGVEEEHLRYALEDLGLSDHVFLHGRQPADAVRRFLETADICLLPSLSEGLSNAVLEAMAMAVPVVSTTAGGMAEAITDGQDGFLAPPWQPAALAEKVDLLLQDPVLRIAIGQAGRRRVEQAFALSHQTACFLEEYTQLAIST